MSGASPWFDIWMENYRRMYPRTLFLSGQTVKGQEYERERSRTKRRRAFEKANPGQEYVDGRTRKAKKRKTNGTSQEKTSSKDSPCEEPISSEKKKNEHRQPGDSEVATQNKIMSGTPSNQPTPPEPENQYDCRSGQRIGNTSSCPYRLQNTPARPLTYNHSEMPKRISPAYRLLPECTFGPIQKPSVKEKQHVVLGAQNELHEFLVELKFDLSTWSDELRAKGMGTKKELLAMSRWEEERLDRVLAKLVPMMPELHRYVLADGILDLATREIVNC
ncbi:hypothetical protein BDZ94DRAFT_1344316 [Collybia nuda]|uniref:Uncharacterized protein n=1 Tax=Collybia nuda TaxID=64659 RepID=A0A9P5XWC2_9AGAR|nr:hypothetical protein BDZ94DRAFT_1344316 [Collybia nuda]